jgi:hypothetical protein
MATQLLLPGEKVPSAPTSSLSLARYLNVEILRTKSV